MLYKKKGFPEEDEFVLCTVTKIQYHSVFCVLDLYNKQGMIHISEISPGRIRNIRDYVQEGKKVVCKILKIDQEKGHIDLSLRRVTEAQKKVKLSLIKQEQRAEKIIENLAELVKKPVETVYKEVTEDLFKEYEMLFVAFEDVVENDVDLAKKGLRAEYAKTLTELVKEKIKPKRVNITGYLLLTSYDSEGVDIIKKATQKIDSQEGVEVTYAGSGKYRMVVTAPDYKQAENTVSESIGIAKEIVESNGSAEFERI